MSGLSLPSERMRAHYDVVVVGSGYGGGVAASRLARCGQRVCVIERGKEFAPGDFPDRFPDVRRELQVNGAKMRMGARTGLFDFRLGSDIHVLIGCGLGGGSLINAGVALRPDARVFADTVWPEEIAGDGLLDEGFARARRMLRPGTHGQAADLTKYRALERASGAVGAPPHAAEVTVSFDEALNPANIAQPACTLCGDCCCGCNVGAKTTVANTYLADAAAHGAEMFTELQVQAVRKEDGRWRVLLAPTLEKRKNGDDAPGSVTAESVVLAAGTLGSTEILLRSRDQGLALSDRLGHNFSANGDIIAFGYGADVPVNAIGIGHPPKAEIDPVGASVSGQIKLTGETLDHDLYLQEGVLPSGLGPLLPALFVPGGRIIGAAKSLLKGVYKGPLANLHTFFVVSHDAAAGRMALKDGLLTIDWPDVAEQPVYARVDAVLERAVGANGGSYVKSPFAGTPAGRKPATAHPLGGCPIGGDRTTGVVNHKCQVFDGRSDASTQTVHDGLYVCDGAIMPRSLGCNPLLTITGLTERAMIHLARDRGWRLDDAPLETPRAAAQGDTAPAYS